MHPEVENLANDSGVLTGIHGSALPGDRYATLLLAFSRGTLKLACDDDTDEIVANVVRDDADGPMAGHGALLDLEGLTVEYIWELRNHRGYVDGLQVRLSDGHGREETIQFEVLASAIDVRRVGR